MRTPPPRSIRRLIGTAALLLTAGCAPVLEPVRYIALDRDTGARVTERTYPNVPKPNFLVGDAPTRYEVARDGYTLDFEVHVGLFLPRIEIGVHPYPEYRIGFRDEAARHPKPCLQWMPSETRPEGWFRRDRCGKRRHDAIDRKLRFTVYDRHGNVVADEDIPYRIKWNGFWGYIDAI